MITEGGNVFKDETGTILTQRINLADIPPTIKWLENLTGLSLMDNMLGSTGQKASSGDLDLAVDKNKYSKQELIALLSDFIEKAGKDPKDWISNKGINIHFLTPIAGSAKNGFVQSDFMFLGKPAFSKFILTQGPNSEYKGASRNVLLNSMAKSMGYKLNQNDGIMSREDNRLISDDPDVIAEMLLGKGFTAQDLMSVEAIMAALKTNSNRDALIADWLSHMERAGTPYTAPVTEHNEVSQMARLRDRIVNQGMDVITENPYTMYALSEARIAHPEDLIFDFGAQGAEQAMVNLKNTVNNPSEATIKWDGKPAVIFGRNERGEFVLTDKSGFGAKGYDGLAKSPAHLEKVMLMRKGDRTDLVNMYKKIWPMIEKSVPTSFSGYVMADLLYSDTPPVKNGSYVFTPNTVTYAVDASSALGKQISNSIVGLAVHTYIAAPGTDGKPIDTLKINPNTGVMIFGSRDPNITGASINAALYKQTAAKIKKHTPGITQMFDPASLRQLKISDFPQLLKQYVNSRVRLGNFTNIVPDFADWVRGKSPTKSERILEWINKNQAAFVGVFEIFLGITALKDDLVKQFDNQATSVKATVGPDSGHEGYVANDIKFVDRMKFSKANFAQNNPGLQ